MGQHCKADRVTREPADLPVRCMNITKFGNETLLACILMEEEATMPAETFLVAFHDGYWRVNFDGQWYGAYPNRTAAQRATVVIAKAGDYLPTRVVVRDVDGSEEVVWDPDQDQAPADERRARNISQ
jgi:hypothetical protein